jgi:hypothetical protein
MKKQKNNVRKLGVPKRWTVLFITVTLLVLPIVLYYTVYIRSRTTYLTNRDFRQLAGISNQLEDRIQQLKNLFIRSVNQTVLAQQNEIKQRAENNGSSDEEVKTTSPEELFQQNLGSSLQARIAPDISTSSDPYQEGDSTVSMRLVTGGKTSTLDFVWCASRDCSVRAEARTNLDDIVSPLTGNQNNESLKGSEHREGFDSILIATVTKGKTTAEQKSEGETKPAYSSKVIFQQGSSELHIDSLDNLVRADVPDNTVKLATLSENTAIAEVRLADATYRIYSQPIPIPLKTITFSQPIETSEKPDDSDTAHDHSEKKLNGAEGRSVAGKLSETHWVVCGLVQGSHFRREAWAFPYTLLIIFVFLTGVVALSWPFLKLHFIGPKDRLKLADVYWLGFSLLVASAILTLFMLFGVSYLRSEHLLDGQLKQFSAQINDNFHSEIQDILAEIASLKSKAAGDLSKVEEKDSKTGPDSFPDFTQPNILRRDDVRFGIYPYFRTAVWMDETGHRKLEWTIDDNQSKGGFPDRDYFKRIIEGDSRVLNVSKTPGSPAAPKFWLEPVTSRLTAEKIVIVSTPFSEEPKADDKARVVVLRDVAMTSLLHTVVPPGFGYRIIDNSGTDPSDDGWNEPGKVLFQSSESRQLKENFFEECDNNRSLRSLVFGRAADFASVNYKGETHRVFIQPLDGFPNWSLVVFRNEQPLRIVYLEILTVAGSILLGYAFILLLFSAAIYIKKIWKNTHTEWIWPTQVFADVYRKTLYINLFLCALSLAVIIGVPAWLGIHYDRWMPIFLVVFFAVIGILVLTQWLKLKWLFNPLQSTANTLKLNKLIDRGDAYVCNLVLVLIMAGVLPAIVIYKVAYNEEMKLFVKHAQLTMAQRLAERYQLVRAQYSTEKSGKQSPFESYTDDDEEFIERRLSKGRDVYTDFFFGTTRSLQVENHEKVACDTDLDGFMTGFSGFVPWSNETSLEIGGLTFGKAADRLWSWESSGVGSSTLHPKLPGVENLHIVTQLERFGYSWHRAWLAMTAGFVLIFLILLILTRFVVRRIFLLDVVEGLYLPTFSMPEIKQSTFLVQTSPYVKNGAFDSKKCHYIDLAAEASQDDWVRKVATAATIKDMPAWVFVDHFDFRIDDRAHNNQKLRLIESLRDANKSVIVKSSQLPSDFSFNGPARTNGKGDVGELSDAWAEMMTRFRRVYEAKPNGEVLEKAYNDLSDELDKNKALTKQDRQKILDLAKFTRSECSIGPWLTETGKEIIESLATTKEVDRNNIAGQLIDRTELVYRKLWCNCTRNEKLTLLHLAQDRLLSHNDPEIKPLMQRGLIVFAPDIRLMNETFKAYVLAQCFIDVDESAAIQAAETQARRSSSLEPFKIPILVGFVAAVLFLLFTQKDLANSSWTLVTAATTGIPAVFKLLSLFQSDHTGHKSFNA